MEISQLTTINSSTYEAFKRLIPQLTGEEQHPTKNDLEKIINAEMTYIYVASDKETIVGSLTLILYRIPTGLKGMIEDVVVDNSARGNGVASMLINKAIEKAREVGAKKIELTSRPSRVAANNLYKKLGFELRETNFYRLDLK